MSFLKKYFADFPVPNSLVGRAILLWLSVGILETAITFFWKIYYNIAGISKGVYNNFPYRDNDFFLVAAYSLNSYLLVLGNFLAVLVTLASIWLFMYVCLRFSRVGAPNGRTFFRISAITLFIYYFFRFFAIGFQTYQNPEIVAENLSVMSFAVSGGINLVCFIVAFFAAKFLFLDTIAENPSWVGEMTRAQYGSALSSYFSRHAPKIGWKKSFFAALLVVVLLELLKIAIYCGVIQHFFAFFENDKNVPF